MSDSEAELLIHDVETVENSLYKIRIYTYSDGYFDKEFYAENSEEAKHIADNIMFSYDNTWYWSWL